MLLVGDGETKFGFERGLIEAGKDFPCVGCGGKCRCHVSGAREMRVKGVEVVSKKMKKVHIFCVMLVK